MADNRIEFELAMKDMATKELQRFKQELANTTSVSSGFNKNIGDGEQLLKNFYREQRIQDRTMREATQALTGFTVGMSGLLMSGSGASNAMKQFNGAILGGVTAMQGAEFASASLGIAGRNLGGTMGKLAGFLSGNAGVIGAVVGATVALYQMVPAINAVDDATAKASTSGLSEFEKRLREILNVPGKSAEQAGYDVLQIFAKIQQGIKDAETQIASMYENVIVSTNRGDVSQRRLKAGFEEQEKTLKIVIDRLKDYKEKISTVVTEVTAQNEINKLFKNIGITVETTNSHVTSTTKDVRLMQKEVTKLDASWKLHGVTITTEVGTAYDTVRAQIASAHTTAMETAFSSQRLVSEMMSLIASSVRNTFEGGEAIGKNFFKSLANSAINFAEMYLGVAASVAWSRGVASFGATIPGDIAFIATATAFLEGARFAVDKFHNGGTVGDFPNQPASREFPIMVRGGETVRTEGQERDLQNSAGRGRGSVININFNSPVSDSQFVMMGIKKALRETGLTIDKLAVNNRSKIALA